MSVTKKSVSTPTRRSVVAAAGAVSLAVPLAACGSDDKGGTDAAAKPDKPEDTGKAEQPQGGGKSLAKASEVPVGGGMIFADAGVVVTQPTQGQFKAFSAICTHQGCKVTTVADGTINCPCHGSKFSIEDGSVKNPPAQKPLPAKQVKVTGDEITLA